MSAAYLGLFASALLAATIVPFYSEVVLYTLLRAGEPALWLVIVATAGNTLGAVINWLLGLGIQHFRDRRWFWFSRRQIDRAETWFNRYGVWTLLFAWLPVGGDALTLIAGILRVRFGIFILLVGIGKAARYVVIAFATDWSH